MEEVEEQVEISLIRLQLEKDTLQEVEIPLKDCLNVSQKEFLRLGLEGQEIEEVSFEEFGEEDIDGRKIFDLLDDLLGVRRLVSLALHKELLLQLEKQLN